jgi:hypothetical protein
MSETRNVKRDAGYDSGFMGEALLAFTGPKPHPVILSAAKDLKKLGRYDVERHTRWW